MKRRRIVAPADMALGVLVTVGGLYSLVAYAVVGDGFWTVCVPAALLVIMGLWIVRREWRRKP